MAKSSYEMDFEEYIRHVDASKAEKAASWRAGIGLQQVDGLTPSAYLYETARKNIEGEITFEEVGKLIDSYYINRSDRSETENRIEEADKVSYRIAQILSEPSFNFSPSYLISIHKKLFQGIFKFAGRIRDYDISKKEWVLNGDSVMYGASFELKAALDYDFEMERQFSYKNLSKDEIVKHITFFVSRLWQIHAFGEGNTRTIAVFTIKYLRSLGFKADNTIFEQNSWYFRNALVRANYNNIQKGISENSEYLEKFFRNLLLAENNELKNRFTHIDYDKFKNVPNVPNVPNNDVPNVPNNDVPNVPNNDVPNVPNSDFTQRQNLILGQIKIKNSVTGKELADILNVSEKTIKRDIADLKQKGILTSSGKTNSGVWIVREK